MTPDTNAVELDVRIEAQHEVDPDELDQLTRDLRKRLKSLDVESVDPVREQESQPGAKGDLITVGALTVVVIQSVLPKLVELLQAWSLRNQGHVVKVKVNRQDSSIEVEFPESTDPEKAKQFIEMVKNAAGKSNKSH